MLFNLLALALPFGQSTFSSLEDHRPLASMAVCVFGLHSLGPYTFLAHSGLVPLESVTMFSCLQEFIPSSWGPGMLTQGERAAEQHTYINH